MPFCDMPYPLLPAVDDAPPPLLPPMPCVAVMARRLCCDNAAAMLFGDAPLKMGELLKFG